MDFFAQFLPFAVLAYLISVGFGMIVAQGRGVQAVNRFWVRSIRAVFRFILQQLARFINWLSRLF